jgi:hypothetical protein
MTNTVTAVGTTNQEIGAVIRKGVCMGTTTEFTTESGEFYCPYDVLDRIENYITQVESHRPDLKAVFDVIRDYADDDSLDGYTALDLIGQYVNHALNARGGAATLKQADADAANGGTGVETGQA